MGKVKDQLFDLKYAIQDVWEEAEKITSMSVHQGLLGPVQTVEKEMEIAVKFLMFVDKVAQPTVLESYTPEGFKTVFEQVYKEEGISL
jgi:hypothetical protein